MAIGCGIVWGLIVSSVPFLYLNFLLAPGFGYVIGEVIGLSVNRKRGTGLAIVAGVSLGVSYAVSLFSPLVFFRPLGLFHPLDLIALGLGVYIAVTRLR